MTTLLLKPAGTCRSISSIHEGITDKEVEKIKELVVTSYVHGAFNELNPEAMAKAFHKDFAIRVI